VLDQMLVEETDNRQVPAAQVVRRAQQVMPVATPPPPVRPAGVERPARTSGGRSFSPRGLPPSIPPQQKPNSDGRST